MCQVINILFSFVSYTSCRKNMIRYSYKYRTCVLLADKEHCNCDHINMWSCWFKWIHELQKYTMTLSVSLEQMSITCPLGLFILLFNVSGSVVFLLQLMCVPRVKFVTRICFLWIDLWLLNSSILLLPFFIYI